MPLRYTALIDSIHSLESDSRTTPEKRKACVLVHRMDLPGPRHLPLPRISLKMIV
jgi:hypothetical protein